MIFLHFYNRNCVIINIMTNVDYRKLWKLLIDRDMKKKDLMDRAGISWSTITKMGHDEHVSTDILVKICSALNCEFDEIMEIVPNKEAD